MDIKLIKYIKSSSELDEFLSFDDGDELFFLFKYSPRCMTSSMIEQNFDSWLGKISNDKIAVAKINVIEQRKLSRGITEKYDISHQSPQLLCFDSNGSIVWHGSHGEINEANLNDILKK